ncbi:MAG: transcriptional regulator [Coriobacteriia bacterium]|nr:transcriptional regulator [Coriobacteriia bacterium]
MNILESYFLENNIITNKQAEEMGIKRHVLATLVKNGELERVKSGVYKKKGALDDDFAAISLNNDLVVFSYHTALYLLGFSDRIPNVYHISVPQGYNAGHIKQKFSKLKIHYVKRELFDVGIIQTKTPFGNYVKCYSIERCISDLIVERKQVDKQIFRDAITGYFNSKEKDIRTLIKYSRILGTEDEIRKYTEILL